MLALKIQNIKIQIKYCLITGAWIMKKDTINCSTSYRGIAHVYTKNSNNLTIFWLKPLDTCLTGQKIKVHRFKNTEDNGVTLPLKHYSMKCL